MLRSSMTRIMRPPRYVWRGIHLAPDSRVPSLHKPTFLIEMRSDTFTEPTAAMREAMATCVVGDDVWRLDPTVDHLQSSAAALLNKPASLFVPSATMANLIAVMAHCTGRGQEILLGDRSHILLYEQGGCAVVGGVVPRTVITNDNGEIDLGDLVSKIRSDDVVRHVISARLSPADGLTDAQLQHFPSTSLVCIENTHNMCGGRVLSIDYMARLGDICRQHRLPLHLDGSRLFNAAAALGAPIADLAADADSITICLSKGLAAPVGALLVADQDFIDRARRLRKVLGGGMRQAGVLAACGIIALRDNGVAATEMLAKDHALARQLARGFEAIPGVWVSPTESNMVRWGVDGGRSHVDMATKLAQRGVMMAPILDGAAIRACIHYQIDDEMIGRCIEIVNEVVNGK